MPKRERSELAPEGQTWFEMLVEALAWPVGVVLYLALLCLLFVICTWLFG